MGTLSHAQSLRVKDRNDVFYFATCTITLAHSLVSFLVGMQKLPYDCVRCRVLPTKDS